MISQNTIQQIISRIDIIDVVGNFVKLKKRGVNYIGLCPFHNEKTPSFTVSPTKEIYKCFGCGKSGNTITFLMEHEKYSYAEALRWLAARYNIEIEETETSQEQLHKQQTAESLHIINNFAQNFFTNQLWHTEEGQLYGLEYLKQRGFEKNIINIFQLGYSSEALNAFVKTALQQQFSEDILLLSGLAVKRNNELIDTYRNRIIFPIHNLTGKVIGFGARVIGKAEKAPKYINTPENEIYVKSRILYGLYFARKAIDKQNECLLVEGYTDVISLFQAGVENVVASGGTSLTVEQIRLIKKYTQNLTIIYDGDEAGIQAALRGLDMALQEGLHVNMVLIPDGEDPDSFVKKTGAQQFTQFIQSSKKDFIVFQLEILLKQAGNDLYKKNEIVKQIARTISKMNRPEDFIQQQEYIKQCAALLKIDEAGLTALVHTYKREQQEKITSSLPNTSLPEEPSSLVIRVDETEKNILRLLLEYGLHIWDEEQTVAEYIFSELDGFHFENEELENLLELYRKQYYEGLQPNAKSLLYYSDELVRKWVTEITMFPYELSTRWPEKLDGKEVSLQGDYKKDVFLSLKYFKLKKIKKMFEQNQYDMEHTHSADEHVQLMQIHVQLKNIERQLTQDIGTVIFK